jgi:hypothetical protein
LADYNAGDIYLRMQLAKGAACRFSYSVDGKIFIDAGENFKAEPGRWTGAKVGLFCSRVSQINDSGFANIDWFRVTRL